MEAAPDGGLGTTTLRVRIKKVGTGTAYADLAILYPKVDFCSLHDFTWHDSITPEVHSSNNNFASDDDDEGDLPVRRVRSYLAFTPQSSTPKRWRKLRLSGTTIDPFRLGQPVMGERKEWGSPLYGSGFSRVMPQSGPALRPTNLVEEAPLQFAFDYLHSEAELRQAIEQLYAASGYGAEPIAFVPEDTEYEVALGRLSSEHSFRWDAPENFPHRLLLTEDLFVGRSQ